jgi:hypothetical protein
VVTTFAALSEPIKQWAAVSTAVGEITVPVQTPAGDPRESISSCTTDDVSPVLVIGHWSPFTTLAVFPYPIAAHAEPPMLEEFESSESLLHAARKREQLARRMLVVIVGIGRIIIRNLVAL